MSQPSWIGYNLGGRYTIDEELGQGGMSAVYKATDPNLRRTVAVKLIHSHLSSDPEFVRRFEEEAAAVAQLSHPNIIQVFDFNHDGDTYYMVLEFVPGESLQERLERLSQSNRQMSLAEAVEVTASISEAVDYAHKRGMIHRDIKPANIMLSTQGQAILMDFGVVKILGGKQHTATGAVIGTALYMSPEQVRGERPDERADIYSLGVTLFEMLSGHPPFEADSAMTTMMMHLNDPIPDIRQINPDTPEDLKAVIEKALAKDPAARFQSAGEMAAALRAVLAGMQTRSTSAAATTLEQPETNISQAATFLEAPPMMEEAAEMDQDGTFLEAPAATPSTTAQRAAPADAPAMRAPQPPSAPPARGPARKGIPTAAVVGGIAVVAVLAIVVTGIFVLPGMLGGSGGGEDSGEEVAEPAGEEAVAAAAPTETTAPTEAPLPTDVPPPTEQPTATVPAGPFVQINDIALDGNTYVVSYETFGYEPALPGMHIHFFFDSLPPELAGVPSPGGWYVYGGPNPFTGYTVGERPAEATQMCALVANPDHSVQQGTGTCIELP